PKHILPSNWRCVWRGDSSVVCRQVPLTGQRPVVAAAVGVCQTTKIRAFVIVNAPYPSGITEVRVDAAKTSDIVPSWPGCARSCVADVRIIGANRLNAVTVPRWAVDITNPNPARAVHELRFINRHDRHIREAGEYL